MMDTAVDKPQFAWQPLTARGVAAFAYASSGRLLVVQLIVALVAAGALVWFLQRDWFPVVSDAINQLPAQGEIHSGRLEWQGNTLQPLAENRFLALVVDLKHEGEARSPAHVQVEFGRTDFKVFSLFGFVQGSYPRQGAVGFNQPELEPWWGAWAPAILAIVALAVIAGLMLIWAFLAAIYCLPAWLVGFFANRDLSLRGSRRLAGAALMPGALFLTAAIVLYGLGAMDLLELTLAAAMHLVIGWIYLFVSTLCLPRHPEVAAAKPNPFIEPAKEPATKEPPKADSEKQVAESQPPARTVQLNEASTAPKESQRDDR